MFVHFENKMTYSHSTSSFFFNRYPSPRFLPNPIFFGQFLSVIWKNKDDDDKTALHACVSCRKEGQKEWMGLETAELLIQNGSKIDTQDRSSQTVIDSAIVGNAEREMVEYLMARVNR